MQENKQDFKSYGELLKSLEIVENFFRKRTFDTMADTIHSVKNLLEYFIRKEQDNESKRLHQDLH